MRGTTVLAVTVAVNALGYAAYRATRSKEAPPAIQDGKPETPTSPPVPTVAITAAPTAPTAPASPASPASPAGDDSESEEVPEGAAGVPTSKRTSAVPPGRKRRPRPGVRRRKTSPQGSVEETRPSPPETARIDILSTPTGAHVKIDKLPKGRTPVVGLIVVPNKKISVALTRAGYEKWSSTLVPTVGTNPTIVAELKPTVPTTAPPPPPKTSPPPAPVRVARNVNGLAQRGATVVKRCDQCHSKTAPRLSPDRYTRDQWDRYFANARHERHSPLGKLVNSKELADIKAHLKESAADSPQDTAAGVR